jgi:hypothetical protein
MCRVLTCDGLSYDLRQEMHGEAGVLRKVGGEMHMNIEVSTVSWSGGNAKTSP